MASLDCVHRSLSGRRWHLAFAGCRAVTEPFLSCPLDDVIYLYSARQPFVKRLDAAMKVNAARGRDWDGFLERGLAGRIARPSGMETSIERRRIFRDDSDREDRLSQHPGRQPGCKPCMGVDAQPPSSALRADRISILTRSGLRRPASNSNPRNFPIRVAHGRRQDRGG
jgi:hypothetical protein